MKKKVLALALALCLCCGAVLMTGCGQDDGKIIMGTNAEFEPFEYKTESGIVGNFDGLDIAIAQEIAKDMGKELVVEDMDFGSLIGAVSTGKVNFVAAGMTIKPDRLENADFSDTYFDAGQVIIVKKGQTAIKSNEDLKDKKIGVQEGTTGDEAVSELGGSTEVFRFKKGMDAVLDLNNDKIDAVVIDEMPARAFVAKNEGLEILAEPFTVESYAIAVKKGDTATLEAINKTLKRIKEDGTFDELYKKYIDAYVENFEE